MTDILPTVLEDIWRNSLPGLMQIRATLSSGEISEAPRIIRVGQLDSELLDQELSQLLQEPLSKALSLVNSTLKARFEPELGLLIQLTLYKMSIWNTGASYGAKLQDLKYVLPSALSSKRLAPSGLARSTLALHAALTLILPYCHNRARSHALSHAWPDAPSSDYRRKAWDILSRVESIYGLVGLLNFVVFLWGGRYRTLADRLLKMRLTPSRRLVKHDVSYEFMNRQMVWHAFTEFLLFLLPLINARTVRRRFHRMASILSAMPLLPLRGLWGISSSGKSIEKSTQKRGKYWAMSEDQCVICVEKASFSLNISEPTNVFSTFADNSRSVLSPERNSDDEPAAYPICNPYQTSCGHVYCYHCLAECMMRTADEAYDELGWECLRCGIDVKEAHRFHVEISESEVSESDYDFSSDLDLSVDLSGSMGSYTESGLSE